MIVIMGVGFFWALPLCCGCNALAMKLVCIVLERVATSSDYIVYPSSTLLFHPQTEISAIAIALGDQHTCAIVTGGGVKCWGWNGNGQLGIGNTNNQYNPADVAGA
jgi:hypothetical protein